MERAASRPHAGAPAGALERSRDATLLYFRRSLGSWKFGLWALSAAGFGAAIGGPHVYGRAIAAAVAVLIVAGLFYLAAQRQAEHAFCQAYARARGLRWSAGGSLPAATPLLGRGNSRSSCDHMEGTLPGGVEGTLALYTYVIQSGRSSTSYSFTIVLTEVPESLGYVSRLFCERRAAGAKRLFAPNLVPGGKLDKVELESEAVDEHFLIRTARGQDQSWLRQLFSPTFQDWLGEQAPEALGFELVNGTLCVSVDEWQTTAQGLDALCEAASRIAARIREESLE